jgi:hypothetical protein
LLLLLLVGCNHPSSMDATCSGECIAASGKLQVCCSGTASMQHPGKLQACSIPEPAFPEPRLVASFLRCSGTSQHFFFLFFSFIFKKNFFLF